MSTTTTPPHTASEWDALIDRFLASGLTQTAFCKNEGLARYSFAYYYQRSDKFAGIRKGTLRSKKTNTRKTPGFRPVHKKPAPSSEPSNSEQVSIHIGHDVRLHCPANVAVDAIARLVRESRS